MYAVQLPLKHAHGRKLWLSVEVVRGLTPFLFSKKAFKTLQGSLDTQTDQCVLSKVQDQPISLQTSPTGLYLIDMLDICQGDATAFTHMEAKQCFSDRSHSQFGVSVFSMWIWLWIAHPQWIGKPFLNHRSNRRQMCPLRCKSRGEAMGSFGDGQSRNQRTQHSDL